MLCIQLSSGLSFECSRMMPYKWQPSAVALNMLCVSLNLFDIFYRAFVCVFVKTQIFVAFSVLVWVLDVNFACDASYGA